MSLKLKEKTKIFPQKEIKKNISRKYHIVRKSLSSDDAALFFILTDTTYGDKNQINIEKVHKNVFQKAKIAKITISEEDMETLEIMLDPKMREEIKSRMDDVKKGNLVSWNKIKDTI